METGQETFKQHISHYAKSSSESDPTVTTSMENFGLHQHAQEEIVEKLAGDMQSLKH